MGKIEKNLTPLRELDQEPDELDGDNQQFVTFHVGDEVFGAPISAVQEIIRVPPVVRVPMGPPSLLGVANLRGTVLPVISLRDVFALSRREYDDATRVLVINLGQPLGFVVDAVSRVVSVQTDQIQAAETIQGTVSSELLAGVIKHVGDQAMVLTVDFTCLINTQFATLAMDEQVSSEVMEQAMAAEDKDKETDAGDELQLVSFEVAEQEYAVAIEEIKEIVQVPEHVVAVPHTESHVLGVMTLRNRLLPLVSLRRMFGLPLNQLQEQHRIVVVSLDGKRGEQGQATVGVVVDSVTEVLRVNQQVVEELPPVLAQDSQLAELTAICRLNDGKRLVSVLSGRKLFANQVVVEALKTTEQLEEETVVHMDAEKMKDAADDEAADQQLVVFRLDNDEFGVRISSVKEIVRVPESLTRVPNAPTFIEGVINLRGTVLPVVDQRRRFGLESIERNDRQRIIVLAINGTRTGFIVDHVSEVLRISDSWVKQAPQMSVEQSRLIKQVVNLEQQKRMILLLDVSQLLTQSEVSALEEVAG
jgi:purine-binding chemotaxis protein CheW